MPDPTPPLTNSHPPLYRPDGEGLVHLDGVALALVRAVALLAHEVIKGSCGLMLERAESAEGDDLEGIYLAIKSSAEHMDFCEMLGSKVSGDIASLDVTDRNRVRRLCHQALANMLGPDPTRTPERVLEMIGPWFEEA